MASLTDWAEAVRAEAERSRRHSLSLRMRIQRQVKAAEERRLELERTLVAALRPRPTTFRTPWSDLRWRAPVPDDEHVLELIDR